jgi:hypothetical protein
MPRYTIPRCARCDGGALAMFAVIGFVCGVVAAILKLTNQHTGTIIWELIIGLIAVSVEVLWGWHRSGYYGHRGAA